MFYLIDRTRHNVLSQDKATHILMNTDDADNADGADNALSNNGDGDGTASTPGSSNSSILSSNSSSSSSSSTSSPNSGVARNIASIRAKLIADNKLKARLEAERKATIALECLDTIERMMRILENEARTKVSTCTDFVIDIIDFRTAVQARISMYIL